MKKYKGVRNMDEICEIMKTHDLELNMDEFNKGGDFINFKGYWYEIPLTLIYNVCNGQFHAYNGLTSELLATEKSENLDDVLWYDELLNVLYKAA